MKRLIKKAEKQLDIGDKVIFKTHPYDNTAIYIIQEILANGNYFIANDETAYTDINSRNLEKSET